MPTFVMTIILCVWSILSTSFFNESFSKDVINVQDFGALGNGKVDDTKSIQKAINEAERRNKIVVFPMGIYLVSSLEIKASLLGKAGVTIRRVLNSDLAKFNFCKVFNQRNLIIENLIFDGSVRVDEAGQPVSGSTPLFLYNSQNVEIRNCEFVNSSQSGIRIEACVNIELQNCKSKNSNGNFGDGFYITDSKHVMLSKCSAVDYTRIGFVTEKNSVDLIFKECVATNGHSASILNGGSEYNAGFWFENSGNVNVESCSTSNNTHYGFVATSGASLGKVISDAVSLYSFKNCISDASPIGFKLASRGYAVKMELIRCIASGAERGFTANARMQSDIFTFDRCSVQLTRLTDKSLNKIGFMWESAVNNKSVVHELPIFNFNDCFVSYREIDDINYLLSTANNNGDISTHSGGKAKINILNLRNSLDTEKVIIKARTGNPTYTIHDTQAETKFLK